ncbi:MAG TPA: hypothetical protein EYQ50_09015 [Verrucomicrobiales bacterium]|nr:hypothetical protein [Verrucomicrobiales bacterium]
MGYAQRTGVDGLAGGTLGIGYDVFGNFAAETEGRTGGYTSRQTNTITVRGPGSGTTGYDWLATNDDTDATTPSYTALPGSLGITSATRPIQTGADYRATTVTISNTGILNVSVTFGAGNTPTTVINNFDFFTATGITELPEKLNFGYSASTGSANQFHEIRNLEVTTSGAFGGAVPVPEPETYFISILAFSAILLTGRRKKKTQPN